MEAVARVVAVGDGRAQLTCHFESSCKSCGAGRGCGLRLLARDRNIVLDLPRPADGRPGLVPGQSVTISIPDDDVLRAAALAYLPTLLGLLAGALIGHWLGRGDGAVALAGLMGAAGGWWLARGRARRRLSRVSIRPRGDAQA